ncbi:3-hydroxyacyl-ACP dehydratase FabZ [Helicobacter cetorum]|uniref:3-hydroxyacyl-[acyl-carrier-protein] dehydratase FabZ n=1 Tax=Helicobacter cetorum (strain ATCC BAA-540 / CCUG 52418 / MIT 99-5656) TaxID=1163745 RepID=I0ESP8_HELCM|nr:3-hydroxyacyl-ACP dehydratase FabZ [Helicobacter cetorum]AFI05967.1 (3R)-hydroxymyristoyl-ACP dehydratase [Helicobacter cetorum MIT 99-5656]
MEQNNHNLDSHFSIEHILQILPHRYPMLLIDRVVDLQPYKNIVAYKNISFNEDVFNGHFPNKPIFPGVLIVEGMAQSGGFLAFTSLWGFDPEMAKTKIVYFMTIDKVKFRIPVVPGDRLEYHLEVLKHKGMIWQVGGTAQVDGKVVAEAELKAMIAERN